MFYYLFLGLRQQRGRSMLAGVGFLLAACALILLSAATQTTVIRTTQIINQNWRSTYDLVVIPAHQALPGDAAIPPDQFEGYNGGISMEQYKQIKQLPGVAVAAPIAYISYALFPTTSIDFGSAHLAPGFYRVDWNLTAFNGQQQITEYQSTTNIYASPSCSGVCDLSDSQKAQLTSIGVNDYFFPSNGPYETGVPNPGSFLLAAIDPVAENQLVHLDHSIVEGSPLPQQTSLSLDVAQPSISGMQANEQVPNYDVPLLINTQLPGTIVMHASFVRLLTASTDPRQIAALGGGTYLAQVPQQTIYAGNIPIAQNDLQIFAKGTSLVQTGSSMVIQNAGQPSFALNFTASPASLTYQPVAPPKGRAGPAYTLVPSPVQNPAGTQGSEVAFRPLNALPGNLEQQAGTIGYAFQAIFATIYNGATYTAQQVGEFDGSRLSAEFANALNWLPENTYTPSPVVLRYDAQGHPVSPTSILPTTNQAGFTLQPPLALTTLAAAQKIRGNDCISVIRVRVAGTVTPGEAGWKRVAQVAQEIHQRTGLQAIVTLGSSPQPTLVSIPGIKADQYPGATQTIQPLGWVEERWIAVGAGLVYLNQSQETQTLLLVAILLVCLGYIAITLNGLVSARRREMAVLSALGWEPWQAAANFLSQAFILALGGSIVGIGLASLIIFLIGASPPWLIITWTIPIILGLAILAALYPLWQLWQVQPAEVLRQGIRIARGRRGFGLPGTRVRLRAHLPALLSLALHNLARSRLRTFIACGSLFLSAGLLTVMVVGLLAFRQSLQGTLLGEYVLLQTAVPQLAGALVALLLTFLSVADLLLLQVRERQREIGLLQAVGWQAGAVHRLFVEEGLLLALAGAIPGVLAAAGMLLAQHQATGALPFVGLGTLGFLLVVAALAALPALQALGRLSLSDVLRAE